MATLKDRERLRPRFLRAAIATGLERNRDQSLLLDSNGIREGSEDMGSGSSRPRYPRERAKAWSDSSPPTSPGLDDNWGTGEL